MTFVFKMMDVGLKMVDFRFKGWYISTFCMSIVWMGILVEIMVDNAVEV